MCVGRRSAGGEGVLKSVEDGREGAESDDGEEAKMAKDQKTITICNCNLFFHWFSIFRIKDFYFLCVPFYL